MVRDGVGDSNDVAAEIGLDTAAKAQVFAEDCRLAHLALGPQSAGVWRAPLFSVADQSRGDVGDPAMEPIPDRLAKRIVVLTRVDLGSEQGVVEAGGYDQTRERSQPTKTILVAILVQTRMPQAGRGPPAKGAPGVFGWPDIHRPIDQHVERQTAAGAEL